MHFDKYYYPALEYLKSNVHPLTLNQIVLTGLDESYIRSIYNEMAEVSLCKFDGDLISITDVGEQYLVDNNPNPENKELYIRILEHLKANCKYGHKIDVVSPFLYEVATYDQRHELVKVLRRLRDEDGYINLDGRVEALCDKVGGAYYSIHHTGLKASLTEKGEAKLASFNPVEEKPTVSNTYHFPNAVGTVIGDNNQSSIIAETITTTPININATPKASNRYNKILKGILIAAIGGIIAGIVLWYLFKK